MTGVNSEGAVVHVGRTGDVISVGGLSLTVLNPSDTNDTTNNNSIVLLLSYGDTNFLFMGDAEKEAEMSILSKVSLPDIDILKVGHHGSYTASSHAFINAINQDSNPFYAIYMASDGNSYGHPHQETIVSVMAHVA